jgi:hypothetical protein
MNLAGKYVVLKALGYMQGNSNGSMESVETTGDRKAIVLGRIAHKFPKTVLGSFEPSIGTPSSTQRSTMLPSHSGNICSLVSSE